MSKKTGSTNAKARSGFSRNILFVVIAVIVFASMAAILLYESDDSQSSQSEAAAWQAALVSEQSPSIGNPNAKVRIVEFLDPACGTCAMFYPMVKSWMAQVPGDIHLSVRHLAFHDGSEQAVKILEASRKQDKYWETLEVLLKSQSYWVQNHVVQADKILPAIKGVGLDIEQLQTDMNAPEVLQRIEKDKQDSVTLKVTATPEYFVNGRPLPSFGQQQLADLIREELGK